MFRGYDLRGIVGQDLTPEIVEHLGKAHGTYLKRHGLKNALIGFDCRATSEEYADALARGYNWAGIDVVNIGMTLVGTFYWAQYFLKIEGGAFVTASHNPAEYNGFKFAIGYSETMVSEGIQELRHMVEVEDYEQGEKVGIVTNRNIFEDYIKFLQDKIQINKKLKVVVDASCSTGGVVAPPVFRAFGMEVVEKNCKIDPTFPLGTPDPTEKVVAERMSQEVTDAGADVGFAYDADGDRIGLVDEAGGIIWNDVLLAIFAQDILMDYPGEKIMYNTLCSKVVEDTILSHGGVPFMWRTGHSFLKKKNQEVGAPFVGELSGHFFFSRDFYNHDDGIYSALRVLRYLDRSGKKLSEIVAELPKYISSPEVKVFCADDKKIALMAKLSPILKKDFPDAEVIDDERAGDGIRLNMPDAMFVIRYSQNGPYITIKFEGKTEERYETLKKYINDLLHQFSEIDWGHKSSVNVDSLTE